MVKGTHWGLSRESPKVISALNLWQEEFITRFYLILSYTKVNLHGNLAEEFPLTNMMPTQLCSPVLDYEQVSMTNVELESWLPSQSSSPQVPYKPTILAHKNFWKRFRKYQHEVKKVKSLKAISACIYGRSS